MRRREISVDLTALLDVILIILFMFVVNSSQTVADSLNNQDTTQMSTEATVEDVNEQIVIAKSELEELLKQQKDLQSQSEEINNKVISDSIWLSTCLKINISIELNEDKTSRVVKIQQRDEEVDEYTYATSRPYKEIIDDISTIVKNNYLDVENVEQIVLFVYTFDYENGKMENHMIMEQVLANMQKQYDNIYVTKHDISKNESTVVEKTDNEVSGDSTQANKTDQETEQNSNSVTSSPANNKGN